MHIELWPTTVTPFLENGTIDYRSLEKLFKHFKSMQCDGVFAVCQSSEMFFLSDDEKIQLAKKSIELCRAFGMKCVVSGHAQDALQDQIAYLKRLEELEPDAIILVNNRLAQQNEDECVAIENLRKICAALHPKTKLGVYECPYPYKRLLTEELLHELVNQGRFYFVKDTCCEIDKIKERLSILSDTHIALYNANAATFRESIENGAQGYSGVLLNYVPEMFAMLKEAVHEQNVFRSNAIFSYLSAISILETQNYPANAKYMLMKKGIFETTITRNGKPVLNESQTKEMQDFIHLNANAQYHLLKKEPVELLFRYDDFFKECHASTVLPLDNGNILVTYFAGVKESTDDVAIYLSEYAQGSWKAPRLIAKVKEEAHWNPVIYRAEDGIRIVFKVGKKIPTWESYSMLSTDEGTTWSKPCKFSQNNVAGGPVRNKPIWLSNGSMLAPNSDETQERWSPRIDISTDGGVTFEKNAIIPVNTDNSKDENTYMMGLGAIQPTLWESTPGHVHALLRTTSGYIFRSDSSDFGKTWCTAYKTELPNNNSGIDLVKHKDDLYLVMNPVTGDWAPRTPIVLMRSSDNGHTFENFRTLENTLLDDAHQRMSEFSYPAIVAKDNNLFITFTYQRKSIAFVKICLEQ